MRVVLVGPTHPYTGGIAQHTTRLARELEGHGHETVVESWRAQYPKALYPGTARVPDGVPEIGVPSKVIERLAWYSPLSWWRAGRRHRTADVVAFSVPTPFHLLPYTVLRWGLGRTPHRIALVHNVLPHEPGPADRFLMGLLLRQMTTVLVHSEKAKDEALSLGVAPESIRVASLPSPWPAVSATRSPRRKKGPLRVLFFGTIRPYKGLDLALEALAMVPAAELTIRGEPWGDVQDIWALIDRFGVRNRVDFVPGYVRSAELDDIFAEVDVLLLPYRSGTGSIVREVGFRYGVPVIATRVGSIAEGIMDGVNGLTIEAGSAHAIAEALREAGKPGRLKTWRTNIEATASAEQSAWERYVEAVVSSGPKGSHGH